MTAPIDSQLDEKKQLLQKALPRLRQQYGLRDVWLFGSYVRGEQTSASDLDILVTFETPPTLFQIVRLQNELSERLNVTVDLVMKSSLKPGIGERILAEAVPV